MSKSNGVVIMLPTKKASALVLNLDNDLEYDEVLSSYGGVSQQHLYLIEKTNIKIGDYYTNGRDVFKCIDLDEVSPLRYDYLTRIVATTDKDIVKDSNSVFNIKTEFISDFIKSFNERQKNKIVEIENNKPVCQCDTFEQSNSCTYSFAGDCKKPHNGDFYGLFPKVDPIDKSITLKIIKDNWSREEVILELRTMHINLYGADRVALKNVDEWIEKNL